MYSRNRCAERPRSPTVRATLAVGALAARRTGRSLVVDSRRLLLAVSLTLLASLALAGTTSAAPGRGAEVVKESDCHTFDELTLCHQSRGVFNETLTPSGNLSVHEHGYWSLEFRGSGSLEGCRFSDSSRHNFHTLYKPGDDLEEGPHEQSGHARFESSGECFDEPVHCRGSFDYHYVDGKAQFSRFEYSCNEN